MDKISETREFLKNIGMPKQQQADICCYVILAMAGIKPEMPWNEATNEWIRIHDIIQFALWDHSFPVHTQRISNDNISVGFQWKEIQVH